MAYENLLYAKNDAIATITVNRPKSLNALNPATLAELADCVKAVRGDPTIRGVVITGAGDRAFVAGADIAAMIPMKPFEQKAFAEFGQAVLASLEALPVAVIAAVNGFALGGGAELALACDLVIASEKARFGLPEINLGIIPGFGGTQRLPRRIGVARAREMIYSGEMIDAETALRYGLVNRVVAAADLMAVTMELAGKLATKAPLALRQAKLAINTGIEMDLDRGCRFEAEAMSMAFGTEDKSEGMSAFLEKRPPKFQGR